MSAVGKNKRKVKGKTLDLSSFLGDQNAPSGFAVVTPRRDWADYVEEENDDKYPSYKKEEKIVLPTAPKAARGPDFDVSKIPSQPPFTAFIGNLPYDITEDEIMRFFGNLKVTSVRLPRDGGGDRGRMRGFGYAEFDDKQALIEALSLNGETLKNRPIKVSLAGENENDRGGERRSDGVDRTAGDWRAAPRGEESFSSRNQRNGTYGKYDDPDRESYRGRSSYGEDRNLSYDGERDRQQYQGRRSTERERDYGFGSDRDKTYNRKYGEGGFDSYDRSRGSSGFDRGGRSERNEENGFKRDDDKGVDHTVKGERRDDNDFKREDDRERGFDRGGRDYDSKRGADRERDTPKERTRLQLKPRSVPVEQQSAAPTATSSIFGGAKPVDTAAKEREIERRLAKEREKHDDLDKPKYATQSGRYTDDRVSRKDYSPKRYDDEPMKEKAQPKDDDKAENLKEDSSYEPDIAEKPCEDNMSCESIEKENGKSNAFLTNKFAHLPIQDVDE